MKIENIEKNIPHEVSELICLKCLSRWIGIYPQETLLKDIECKCGQIGYVIKTGQTLPESDNPEMKNDIRYQNMARMWGEKVAREKYTEFIFPSEKGV